MVRVVLATALYSTKLLLRGLFLRKTDAVEDLSLVSLPLSRCVSARSSRVPSCEVRLPRNSGVLNK